MTLRLLIPLIVAAICSGPASAATIEQAWDIRGHYLWAIKMEGEIVPGDAVKLHSKLLDFYTVFGPNIDTVYLMSKGGDVEEAMKMGTLIRRPRLKTYAPVKGDGAPTALCFISLEDNSNCICASACFLTYAGGADRFGNYLALHRPYLSREAASRLSDVEYEVRQKQVTLKVQEYLRDMEVDQYWIGKMMSTSSQDTHVVTWSEADNRLMGTVPSK